MKQQVELICKLIFSFLYDFGFWSFFRINFFYYKHVTFTEYLFHIILKFEVIFCTKCSIFYSKKIINQLFQHISLGKTSTVLPLSAFKTIILWSYFLLYFYLFFRIIWISMKEEFILKLTTAAVSRISLASLINSWLIQCCF